MDQWWINSNIHLIISTYRQYLYGNKLDKIDISNLLNVIGNNWNHSFSYYIYFNKNDQSINEIKEYLTFNKENTTKTLKLVLNNQISNTIYLYIFYNCFAINSNNKFIYLKKLGLIELCPILKQKNGIWKDISDYKFEINEIQSLSTTYIKQILDNKYEIDNKIIVYASDLFKKDGKIVTSNNNRCHFLNNLDKDKFFMLCKKFSIHKILDDTFIITGNLLSIDVIFYISVLKILYPKNIFVLRGKIENDIINNCNNSLYKDFCLSLPILFKNTFYQIISIPIDIILDDEFGANNNIVPNNNIISIVNGVTYIK
jgi:hypothetical protein